MKYLEIKQTKAWSELNIICFLISLLLNVKLSSTMIEWAKWALLRCKNSCRCVFESCIKRLKKLLEIGSKILKWKNYLKDVQPKVPSCTYGLLYWPHKKMFETQDLKKNQVEIHRKRNFRNTIIYISTFCNCRTKTR